MITYNHEEFIREAIEGVLMQEVDFPVELVIADDASPDGTSQVVQDYINNHPRGHWIKYFRHAENKGMMPNFVWALEKCKGKYIALCEGDDYWIDKFKLKKQIDFLENNSNFSLCYHSVNVLFQDGKFNSFHVQKKNISLMNGGLFDLALYGNFIHTPSVVIRNDFNKIPDYFLNLEVGDFFYYLFVCRNSKFIKLNFVGCVYRYGTGSFSKEPIQEIRRRFKKSLFVASGQFPNLFVRMILWLRVHQDNLYSNRKLISNGLPFQNFFGLLLKINFIQVFKALIKAFFRVESRKI